MQMTQYQLEVNPGIEKSGPEYSFDETIVNIERLFTKMTHSSGHFSTGPLL